MLNALYSKDNVTIYCANAEDVIPRLPAGSVGTLVLDAPHGDLNGLMAIMTRLLRSDSKVLVLARKDYMILPDSGAIWSRCAEICPQAKYGHPNVRPLAAMHTLLKLCSPDPIFDPYMGTGTTLIAARDLGREAIGIEQNAKDCRTAVARLEAVQGVTMEQDVG